MDYEKAWNELKNYLNKRNVFIAHDYIQYKCYSDYSSIQKAIYLEQEYNVVGDMLKKMYAINQKYQPKQYTWNEILEMSPLPKHIKSMCSTDIYPLKENVYYVKEHPSYTDGNIYCFAQYRYPSIIEMKNKWTIVEE